MQILLSVAGSICGIFAPSVESMSMRRRGNTVRLNLISLFCRSCTLYKLLIHIKRNIGQQAFTTKEFLLKNTFVEWALLIHSGHFNAYLINPGTFSDPKWVCISYLDHMNFHSFLMNTYMSTSPISAGSENKKSLVFLVRCGMVSLSWLEVSEMYGLT